LDDYTQRYESLKDVGIWDYKMIIGREVVNQYLPNRPFVITAVVNSGAKKSLCSKRSHGFLRFK
jgi:hypothetical protein